MSPPSPSCARPASLPLLPAPSPTRLSLLLSLSLSVLRQHLRCCTHSMLQTPCQHHSSSHANCAAPCPPDRLRRRGQEERDGRYVRRLPRFFGSPVMRLWSLETLYSAVRGRTSPFSGSSRGGVREAERGRGRLVGRRTSTPTPAPSHTGAGARRRGGGAHAAPVAAALPRPASRFPGRPGVGQSPNLTAARAPVSPASAVSTSLISEQIDTVVETPEPQPASGMRYLVHVCSSTIC